MKVPPKKVIKHLLRRIADLELEIAILRSQLEMPNILAIPIKEDKGTDAASDST